MYFFKWIVFSVLVILSSLLLATGIALCAIGIWGGLFLIALAVAGMGSGNQIIFNRVVTNA